VTDTAPDNAPATAGDALSLPGVLRRLYVPRVLTACAVIVGWLGIYFAFHLQHWLGIVLPLVTTALTLAALRRGDFLARRRRASLREALDTAAARNRELEQFGALAAVLLQGSDLPTLFQAVADIATDLLVAEGGLITLLTEEGRFLRITATAGVLRVVQDELLPADASLSGWVVSHGEPLVLDDLDSDPRATHLTNMPGPLRTAAIVPLRSAGVAIGTISVHNRRDGRPFDHHDLQLLRTLGDQAVVGLDRARTFDELRRNERQLVAKNLELQRATKLKSEFLANMSHELRTPLNAIIGFSDLMLAGGTGELTAEQRDFLEAVLRNGQHLLGLINSVLDLSKIEAGRMSLALETTDVAEAVSAVVADTASLRAAKRQECDVRVEGERLAIVGDGIRLRQVLFNLLSNASKFTPDGGRITLRALRTTAPLQAPAERQSDEPRLVQRDAVWVSVSDTGIGIHPKDMGKLFQEFSQADSSSSRQQQGTGLGLALCKKFVELHGGTIGAESIPGVGSSFWFLLPADGPYRRPVPRTPAA
jgi:signal transduction histidine kinase